MLYLYKQAVKLYTLTIFVPFGTIDDIDYHNIYYKLV